MNATTLITRAAKRFEELGYTVDCESQFGTCYTINYAKENGHKHIWMETTYRNNGTDEDVTVTMIITEITNSEYGICKQLGKIKIPKNASEKVLNNRINKAIEFMA